MRALLAFGLPIVLGACESSPSGTPPPSSAKVDASASAPLGAALPPPLPLVVPPATLEPNPLKLPPRKITLDHGKRVFTFSDAMFAGAKLGSTLVLYAATVAGLDGDDLIVEGKSGPSYKVHGAYAIPVPDDAKLKPGDPVLTEWSGTMKHAVVQRIVKDRVQVRYTDLEAKTPEATLKSKARFVRQVEGFAPGNYAAYRDGETLRHVLLVSPFTAGEKKMWFALGFGGAAMKVEEALMTAIPIRFTPKVGVTVWAENVGMMRRAAVTALDEPGRMTVRYDRLGKPATIGWGFVMPDPETEGPRKPDRK